MSRLSLTQESLEDEFPWAKPDSMDPGRPSAPMRCLVPKMAEGVNLRLALTDRGWGRLRAAVLRRASHKCEECGVPEAESKARTDQPGRYGLECHEQWALDLRKRSAWLYRLAAVCRRCHRRIHSRKTEDLESIEYMQLPLPGNPDARHGWVSEYSSDMKKNGLSASRAAFWKRRGRLFDPAILEEHAQEREAAAQAALDAWEPLYLAVRVPGDPPEEEARRLAAHYREASRMGIPYRVCVGLWRRAAKKPYSYARRRYAPLPHAITRDPWSIDMSEVGLTLLFSKEKTAAAHAIVQESAETYGKRAAMVADARRLLSIDGDDFTGPMARALLF